jgi:hypothetical protein
MLSPTGHPTYQKVDALNDIQEHLVLPVPDPLASPRYGVRHSDRRPDHFQLVWFLRDVFLQDLALSRLGVTKVHHLVEKLVDNDKVIPDRFLLELFEVFNENLYDLS